MSWFGRQVEGLSQAAVIPVLAGGTAAALAASRGARPGEAAVAGLLTTAGTAVIEAGVLHRIETRGRRTKAQKTPQG